jgi:hypothetical protein
VAILIAKISYAQQFNRCFTHELMLEKEKQQPGYTQRVDAVFNQAKQYAAGKFAHRSTDDTIYNVRCVFHVLYTTPAENIDDSIIRNQIDVLNRDYRRRNADTVDTRPVFKDRAGDTRIEFFLADTDPDGNPTTGITHTVGNPGFLGFNAFTDNAKAAATGGKDPWPTDKYLNIWVCSISAFGVLGYAFPPDNAPNWPTGSSTDSTKQGVVLDTRVVGNNNPDPIDSTVSGGRSAVHEIGHYLGLRHIWGDNNGTCTNDDGLDDTPKASDAHQQTCDKTSNTCVDVPVDDPDMSENYMDYSDDRCLNMFTQQQIGIMHAMLATSRAGVSWVEVVTGMEELSTTSSIDVFPNPTKGMFTVRTNAKNKMSVFISNTVGQTVFSASSENGSSTLDLTSQPTGIYYVKVTSGNESTVKRLEVIR